METEHFPFFDNVITPVIVCNRSGKVIYKNGRARKLIKSPRMASCAFYHVSPTCRADLRRSFRRGGFSAFIMDDESGHCGLSCPAGDFVYLIFSQFSKIVFREFSSCDVQRLGELICDAVVKFTSLAPAPEKKLVNKPLVELIAEAVDFSYKQFIDSSSCGKNGLLRADDIIEFILRRVFAKLRYTVDYELRGRTFGSIFPENPTVSVPLFFETACVILDAVGSQEAKLCIELEDMYMNFILSVNKSKAKVNSLRDMISLCPEEGLNLFVMDAICRYYGFEYSFFRLGGFNFCMRVVRLNEMSSRFHLPHANFVTDTSREAESVLSVLYNEMTGK